MSGITITGGIAKGRQVRKIPPKVRPTPARLRRALFEILGDISELDFIDLFAGSGAVGIEALSRGADVFFVDIARSSCRMIEQNIKGVGLDDMNFEIDCEDAIHWLDWFVPKSGTIVFGSPPYIEDFLPKTLHAFEDFAQRAGDETMTILQFPKRNLPEEFRCEPQRIHKVGDNSLIFWYIDF